jgi:hypothetical protein
LYPVFATAAGSSSVTWARAPVLKRNAAAASEKLGLRGRSNTILNIGFNIKVSII